MRRLSYIRIAFLIVCCLFTTPFCFAQLAVDSHIAEKLTYSEWRKVERNIWKLYEYPAVMVSLSIDELTYDPSGHGVANLDGSFYIHNYHPTDDCSYTGEIRLEILKPIGDDDFLTFLPHDEEDVSGSLKSWDEDRNLSEINDDFSKSLNLHIDCLTGPEEINRDDILTMSAALTLHATITPTTETWTVNIKQNFTHEPEGEHGLGPTATEDGETFSDDCECNGGD